MEKKIRVALVGLGFGKQFIPMYQNHPGAELAAVCESGQQPLDALGDSIGPAKRTTDFMALCSDPSIDAIHLVTPCEDHARMSIAAMKAGKHTACTVPVGMSLEEILQVAQTQKETGMTYMMMETALYTREYLTVQSMRDAGDLGTIQFVRGSHLQDMSMEGWPDFWKGLPPMWYSTHCLAPCLAIVGAGGLAKSVSCLGSGRIREDYIPIYGSPFSFETAHVKLHGSDVVAEISRFVHGVTRQYCETMDIYGSKASVEWRRKSDDDLILFDGGENAAVLALPDWPQGLPEELAGFARRDTAVDKKHAAFLQGGGHGGSYPHLVHEFISAIRQRRPPAIDIIKAANWSAAGFCAHQSALEGGREISIPDYSNL